MQRTRLRILGILFAVGLVLGTAVQLYAAHTWGCYKWAWPTGQGTLNLPYKTVSLLTNRDYTLAYNRSRDAWNTAPPIYLYAVTTGEKLTWYARNYGFNGWLGLATIYINGCTITKGNSKLNNSYLKFASYNQTAIDHVGCQEVGHTFGLDHNRSETTTCMNDTILTAGANINQHDKDLLKIMYP